MSFSVRAGTAGPQDVKAYFCAPTPGLEKIPYRSAAGAPGPCRGRGQCAHAMPQRSWCWPRDYQNSRPGHGAARVANAREQRMKAVAEPLAKIQQRVARVRLRGYGAIRGLSRSEATVITTLQLLRKGSFARKFNQRYSFFLSSVANCPCNFRPLL